jgi:hypothetical protein
MKLFLVVLRILWKIFELKNLIFHESGLKIMHRRVPLRVECSGNIPVCSDTLSYT